MQDKSSLLNSWAKTEIDKCAWYHLYMESTDKQTNKQIHFIVIDNRMVAVRGSWEKQMQRCRSKRTNFQV